MRGHDHVSELLNSMSFGRFNAAFKPNRTDFDWLSRDAAEVDKYVADPDCGFIMSTGGLADMVKGLADVNTDRSASRVPKDLPIHLTSGERCQVGEEGKGPREVADRFRKVGVQDVTLKLWPEARHEILNETNRDEVEVEIVDWLDAHLPAATRAVSRPRARHRRSAAPVQHMASRSAQGHLQGLGYVVPGERHVGDMVIWLRSSS